MLLSQQYNWTCLQTSLKRIKCKWTFYVQSLWNYNVWITTNLLTMNSKYTLVSYLIFSTRRTSRSYCRTDSMSFKATKVNRLLDMKSYLLRQTMQTYSKFLCVDNQFRKYVLCRHMPSWVNVDGLYTLARFVVPFWHRAFRDHNAEYILKWPLVSAMRWIWPLFKTWPVGCKYLLYHWSSD